MTPLDPNRMVALCRNDKELAVVAQAMKESWENIEPIANGPQASKSYSKASENGLSIREEMINNGFVRVVKYKGKLINLVLTRDTYAGYLRWNFSMSLLGEEIIIQRVPDPIGSEIAKVFLGENFKEIEAEGIYKKVRQFEACLD
jgi:hypothetical protein